MKYISAAQPNNINTSDTFMVFVPLYKLALLKIFFTQAINSIVATLAKNEESFIVVITWLNSVGTTFSICLWQKLYIPSSEKY